MGIEQWKAVRAESDRPRLLRAAVELPALREIIYVADSSLAAFIAEALNGLERGDPLPEAGEQHRPRRFQLVHDPTGFPSGTAVVYMNRGKGRIVARASGDEKACVVARILNHVDYPMVSAGALIPEVGAFDAPPSELPDSVIAPPKRRR